MIRYAARQTTINNPLGSLEPASGKVTALHGPSVGGLALSEVSLVDMPDTEAAEAYMAARAANFNTLRSKGDDTPMGDQGAFNTFYAQKH